MDYYKEIKLKLLDNEVNKKVKNYLINKSDLDTYYEVGKMLVEAGKHYGDRIIKKYSSKLTHDLGKGYSTRNLWMMIKFYYLKEKVQTLSAQMTWSHYCEFVSFDDINKINYYINIVNNKNLSVRQLRERIKSNEYERLPKSTIEKILTGKKFKIKDSIKNPIIIYNHNDIEIINEITLHKLILSDIEGFMANLGEYYSFIGSEYKIKIGNRYNYIDLLLYNYKYNCFVVIELKVTELKKRTYWSNNNIYELYR